MICINFSTSGDTKVSVVERFNRTLKQRMYHYFTTNNTLNFVPVLQALVKVYNRAYHRSIKMPPNQVTEANSSERYANLYKNKNCVYHKTFTRKLWFVQK